METLTDAFFAVIKLDGNGILAALAVMIALLIFGRTRASKTALLLLWVVVGFRLVCPWAPTSSLSLFNLDAAQRVARDGTWGIGRLEDVYVGDVRAGVKFTDGVHPEYDQAVAAGAEPVFVDDIHMSVAYYYEDEAGHIAPARTFRERYGGIAALIWLAGMAVFAGYGGISYFLLKRRLRFAVKDETDGVWISDRIPSPCVTGLADPKIYLTFGIGGEEKACVLTHERQHIRNHDQLWKLMGWLILCIHWFNPLLWLTYLAFLETVEEACDQRVLRELGEDRKADYGQALLSLSTRKCFRPCYSPLAFGEGGAKERIKRVLKYKKPRTWITAAAVILCAVVGVTVLTGAAPQLMTQEELEAAGLVQAGEPVSYVFRPHGGWSLHRLKRSGPFPFQFVTVLGCDRVEVSCENSEVWSPQDVRSHGSAIWCKEFSATLPCTVNWCPIPGGDYKGRYGGTVTRDIVHFTLYAGEKAVLRGVIQIQAGKLDWNGGGTFTATAYFSDNEHFLFTANPASPLYSGAVISGAPEGELPPDTVPDGTVQWVMPASASREPGFRIHYDFYDNFSQVQVQCEKGSLFLQYGDAFVDRGRSASLDGSGGAVYWSPMNGGSQAEADELTFTGLFGSSRFHISTVQVCQVGETGGESVYLFAGGQYGWDKRFHFTEDSERTGAVLSGGLDLR